MVDEATLAREQQDKQIANDPNTLYADSMREEKVHNILSQINPDNLLVDIEHRIRGEKKNTWNGEWESISKDRTTVSDDLVSDFISFLGAILNQNTSMSDFSREEINNIMSVVIDWVKNHLIVNAEKYGIEGNYTEYDRIGHIVCTTCFAVFKRALNGQESRRIFKVLRIHEDTSQKSGGGFMDSIKKGFFG